jgi:phosphoenolpyruvate carboxykinase (GTP)
LKWIIDRVKGRASAKETHLGLVPNYEDLTLEGLDFPKKRFDLLFATNKDEWAKEITDIEEFFKKFGSRMPKKIWDKYHDLKRRFGISA